MIPIIDTLAHPTLTGTWLQEKLPCSFNSIVPEMTANGFVKACSIGIAGIEDYEHELFMKECAKHSELIPVAGFSFKEKSFQDELLQIKQLGYTGIKIHPRFSRVNYDDKWLSKVLANANKLGLIVWLCTYAHCACPNYPMTDPMYEIAKALNKVPKAKVILVHAGDVNLLKYAEMTRFNSNVLLDLSLTLMKYRGSSIDLDLAFLFRSFDLKITIGTDYPEYNFSQVRARFEELAHGVSNEKLKNIAHRNISNFIGLDYIY